MPLTVGGGGPPDVVLPLSAGVTVTGRVVFDGALPKPDRATMQRFGIRLEATDAAADRSPTLQTASVDAAGHFVIRGVPAGRYVVKFQATAEDRRAMDGWESVGATLDGVDVSTRPMDVHSDVKDIVLTLSDRAGRLTGTVRDASGAPDPNASVLLFTTDREIWVDSGVTNRRIRSVRAGEDGTFVIPVVHGGEYFLTAIPDDDVDGWDDPRVMEAIARTAMRIRFRDFERKTVDVTTRSVRQERGR